MNSSIIESKEEKPPHIPVMLNEVIHHLSLIDGGTYIDCTFGAGGYSRKIISSSDCKLYAIDQDPSVIQYTKDFPLDRFSFINDNFSNLDQIAKDHNLSNLNGIVFDLGISSMQVDQAERGFSFNKEARLDMRMSKDGIDAWEVVNRFSEEDLADIIYYYGEEHFSRSIARKIVQKRQLSPINTTLELASIVKSSIKKKGKIDPSTKTFQALRIYVNDELKALKQALDAAYNLLKINGKIIIVSFQGLEDRIIKDYLQKNSITSTKTYKPSLEEIRLNPRSRSAKLRTIERLK